VWHVDGRTNPMAACRVSASRGSTHVDWGPSKGTSAALRALATLMTLRPDGQPQARRRHISRPVSPSERHFGGRSADAGGAGAGDAEPALPRARRLARCLARRTRSLCHLTRLRAPRPTSANVVLTPPGRETPTANTIPVRLVRLRCDRPRRPTDLRVYRAASEDPSDRTRPARCEDADHGRHVPRRLIEDDDNNRLVVGLSVGGKGDKALIPPDHGTFESYSQTG
jgi:hypothetical protein